jgi:hypothetical protein
LWGWGFGGLLSEGREDGRSRFTILERNIPCPHPLFRAELLVLVVVRRAVDLGDGDGVVALILRGQLLPDGREPLAVAAPRRKELDQRHAALDGVLQGAIHQLLRMILKSDS